MTRTLRLATRASELALWQARHVAGLLRGIAPTFAVELIAVTSSGDADRQTPLYGMGNVGVFAREVHEAVLDGRADIAVHSCKDLPTTPPDGCCRPVILKRADPRDCLIGVRSIEALPQGATIGSSSLRRRAELALLRPDLSFVNIRGNVATRMAKASNGEVDATILACAGLKRLGLSRAAAGYALDPLREMIPAPAQGAVACDARADDRLAQVLLERIADRETTIAVGIERAVLAGLRGGCSLPLGCHVRRHRARWYLAARLHAEDGVRQLAIEGSALELPELALAELS